MPNIQSAVKRMRSDLKKRLKNQTVLSELHTLYKKLAEEIQTDPKTAPEKARLLGSKLDKAVIHGILPHGRADRKKARIARLLNKANKT